MNRNINMTKDKIMKIKNSHITSNDILLNLSQKKNFCPDIVKHLNNCTVCQKKKSKVEKQFYDLGAMTREYTPHMIAPIRLLETKSKFKVKNRLFASAGLALASTMILIVIFTGLPEKLYFSDNIDKNTVSLMKNLEDDNQLIKRVNTLVEDAMPQKYQDIITMDKTSIDMDFMQDIVPAVNDNNMQSFYQIKKGGPKC